MISLVEGGSLSVVILLGVMNITNTLRKNPLSFAIAKIWEKV